MIRTSVILAVVFVSAAAMAGEGAGTSCAAGLAKDPRAIYDASVVELSPTTDLKTLLTGKTRGLVMAGTIQRASVHGSAHAAFDCLELAQKTD